MFCAIIFKSTRIVFWLSQKHNRLITDEHGILENIFLLPFRVPEIAFLESLLLL